MRSVLLTLAGLLVVTGLAVAQSSSGSAGQDQTSGTMPSPSGSQWADSGSLASYQVAGTASSEGASESHNFQGTEIEKAYQEASEPKNREGFSGFYDPDVTLSSPWNATN